MGPNTHKINKKFLQINTFAQAFVFWVQVPLSWMKTQFGHIQTELNTFILYTSNPPPLMSNYSIKLLHFFNSN
jgi:hypothetical protein